MAVDFNQARFVKSAAKIKQMPTDQGAEVAFIGRSNSGKSRALNSITGRKNLARVSKTPGRTQLINIFTLGDDRRLIDLPGYGYAKVSEPTKDMWARLINQYLQYRNSLQGLIIVMDSRHPLKDADCQLLEWTELNRVPVHILLTKADKLPYGARQQALTTVKNELSDYQGELTVQLFSAHDKWGQTEAQSKLNHWYGFNSNAQ